MAKLVGRRSLARSLALLNQGLTVDQAAAEFKRRYHQEVGLEQVKKAYFPTKPVPISQQQGKSRSEIVKTLQKLKAHAERARKIMRRFHRDPVFAKANAERSRERMRLLHRDPAFAKANAERARETMRRLNRDLVFAKANAERAREVLRRLHSDPAFAKAHAKRSRERLRRLNKDPVFAKAHAERARERLRRLHRNPVFRAKLLAGINRFWNAYRAAKQGALEEMGYGKSGFDQRRRITVERTTPEELAALNEQRTAISMAVSRLPLLHQAVVTSSFDLGHAVPSQHVKRAKALQPAKREKVLQQALVQLRKNPNLKKHAKNK